MWIKSIVLDGFKSYAQRTEINGFDPLFNAITGLNGSGKSNILDGICFLLGITNLSNVRAVNLNELVYKNGQGGITKATVSIVFDNTNKPQSPYGYRHYDEITITRQISIGNRNKYLINGLIANNNRVHDLFKSVQLNVNNPHFLIMQGRITKVLNMKPEEILSMIEEATGTKLYDNKRDEASKVMEKKNVHLLEIDTNLNEEINPKVLKLKEEKASYLEYQKIIRQLEHLNKFHIAYKFFGAEACSDFVELSKKSVEDHLQLLKTLNDSKKEVACGDESLKLLSTVIASLEKKRDEEAGGLLSTLQKAHEEAKNALTINSSHLNASKNQLTSETNKLEKLKRQQHADKTSLKLKKEAVTKLEFELNVLKEKNEALKNSHKSAIDHLKAVKVGLAGVDNGKDATVNEQLRSCKVNISNIETMLEETKIRVELKKLNYEDGLEEKLGAEHRRLEMEVMRISERINSLEARFHQLSFDYHDPESNFNRTSVKGPVAMLMNVKDQKYATALEVVAGGKLYHIVVDTEQTSKKLLDKGQLKRRVTFIPLNKIAGSKISADVLRRAECLVGKENVRTALSLVEYENELEAAMAYVFGTSFICTDMESAKRVTFDEDIMMRSVTLAGDSFDPAGIASGDVMNEQMVSGEDRKKMLLKQIEELEDILKNKDAHMEQQVKKAQDDLDSITHRYEASNNFLKIKEQEFNVMKLELVDLDKEHVDLMDQINSTSESIKKLEEQVTQQEAEVLRAQVQLMTNNYNKDIEAKQLEQHELVKNKKKLLLQIEDMQHKITQANKVAKDAQKKVEQMLKEHAWIAEERNLFNVANTVYDFNANNPNEASKKINKLQDMKEKLSKTVNMRAMSMLNKAEEQQRDLMQKRPVVLSNRAQIEKLITKLDNEKDKALKLAFAQVNEDFGSIFSTLLPGASAKLIATEENGILCGVEFRVGFGNVWKESLSELSGGQRSLVALSLILALLLFKPAPLYILDEVDAALDLSHTQNIGQMLKAHFKHSQFIIVSLKDSMFNNANVLFKTKFVDGVSTITRHTQENNGKSSSEPVQKKKI
ncbi:hypothetical protein HELRODRAFT_156367 [Helobdella robusta]|uniref:SMC hinge domain-containing protein n=1 Tax=Helobdella robusta TaxID=6412 RepID=T1ELU4_HELRO|nr:hypothetical protein HELRODRAFT_156367 [Helobdella robusta]ESO09910.1 hypothetical protein HELRODRAFT_156367 [Helobdella robusta]